MLHNSTQRYFAAQLKKFFDFSVSDQEVGEGGGGLVGAALLNKKWQMVSRGK